MKRLLLSLTAAATLLIGSVGAVAAAPAQASCIAHLIPGIGAPGLAQADVRFDRFGSLISPIARAPGSSFEECFEVFLGVFHP